MFLSKDERDTDENESVANGIWSLHILRLMIQKLKGKKKLRKFQVVFLFFDFFLSVYLCVCLFMS